MPKFIIQVERTYTARHIGSLEIEAADLEEAKALAAKGLEADEDDYLDPTERHYESTEYRNGYDDAEPWEVSDDGHHEQPADAPSWAGLGGGCKVCGGEHHITTPCAGT